MAPQELHNPRLPSNNILDSKVKALSKRICDAKIKQLKAIQKQANTTHQLYNDLLQILLDYGGRQLLRNLRYDLEQVKKLQDEVLDVNYSQYPPDEIMMVREVLLNVLGILNDVIKELEDKADSELDRSHKSDKSEKLEEDLKRFLNKWKEFNASSDKFHENLAEEDGIILEMEREHSVAKDNEWYDSIRASPPADSAQNPKVSAKGNVKEKQIEICTNIIAASERKIISIRLDQFNHILAKYQLSKRGTWGMTSKLESKLRALERDHSIPLKNQARFKNIPEDLAPSKQRDVIHELENAVSELLLDYENVTQGFLKYQNNELEAGRAADGMAIAGAVQTLEAMKKHWAAERGSFDRFDPLVHSEKDTISKYKARISEQEGGGDKKEKRGVTNTQATVVKKQEESAEMVRQVDKLAVVVENKKLD